MRVLVLSQTYMPEPNDIRIHSLAAGLVARGHEVVSIAPYPSYPTGRIYPEYKQKMYEWELIDGVKILRVPVSPDHRNSKRARAKMYASFMASATIMGTTLGGKADAIWAYQPPLTIAIPALTLKQYKRAPLMYHIDDLWPENMRQAGLPEGHFLYRGLDRLANHVYRKADFFTVQSPGMRQALIEEKGVDKARVETIPTWADEDVYRQDEPDAEFGHINGLHNKFNIVWTGNIGNFQALDVVLRCAKRLQELPDVQFVFVGEGVQAEPLREQAEAMNLTNVVFKGLRPKSEMPQFLAWAGASLVHLEKNPLFEITIPGKTYGYMAAGRPILCGVEGNAADLIEGAGCGLTFESENDLQMSECILQLLNMSSEHRLQMGECGRRLFLQRFTKAASIQKTAEILERLGQRKLESSRLGQETVGSQALPR